MGIMGEVDAACLGLDHVERWMVCRFYALDDSLLLFNSIFSSALAKLLLNTDSLSHTCTGSFSARNKRYALARSYHSLAHYPLNLGHASGR